MNRKNEGYVRMVGAAEFASRMAIGSALIPLNAEDVKWAMGDEKRAALLMLMPKGATVAAVRDCYAQVQKVVSAQSEMRIGLYTSTECEEIETYVLQ